MSACPLALLAELRRSGHLDEAAFAHLWRVTSARLSESPVRASAGETTAVKEVGEPSEDEGKAESLDEDGAAGAATVWSKAEQASFARHVRDWEWRGYPAMRGGARDSAKVHEHITHWRRLTASVAAECGTRPRPVLSAYSKACKLRKGGLPWKDSRTTAGS